jgi:hypothetical protein
MCSSGLRREVSRISYGFRQIRPADVLMKSILSSTCYQAPGSSKSGTSKTQPISISSPAMTLSFYHRHPLYVGSSQSFESLRMRLTGLEGCSVIEGCLSRRYRNMVSNRGTEAKPDSGSQKVLHQHHLSRDIKGLDAVYSALMTFNKFKDLCFVLVCFHHVDNAKL